MEALRLNKGNERDPARREVINVLAITQPKTEEVAPATLKENGMLCLAKDPLPGNCFANNVPMPKIQERGTLTTGAKKILPDKNHAETVYGEEPEPMTSTKGGPKVS